LLLATGAISFFLTNIVMKEVLSSFYYGQYSIIITYFSLIFVLGILGMEQVFLRFSTAKESNQIETQKIQLLLVSGVALFSSVVSTIFFKKNYPEIEFNTFLLFLTSFSIISSLFLYNVLRLNSNFFLAQLVANFWKFVLLILAALFYFKQSDKLEVFVACLCFSIIGFFALCLIYVFRTIQFKFTTPASSLEIISTASNFFIAIASFSLITFADRFIIEKKFNYITLGEFFYLTNFFLAPFTILQNYVGFKQLILFKNDFNLNYYFRYNRKIIFFGIFLAFFLFVFATGLNYYKILSYQFNNYTSIALLLVIGIIRLYSSSIISAFEAKSTLSYLRISNVLIVAFTVLILLYAYYFCHTIQSILICVIAVWCLRCLIHRQLLLHQYKKSS
jgi:O-antigen/teichoic acid export membrane protein